SSVYTSSSFPDTASEEFTIIRQGGIRGKSSPAEVRNSPWSQKKTDPMKLEEGSYVIETENQTMVHNDIRNVIFVTDGGMIKEVNHRAQMNRVHSANKQSNAVFMPNIFTIHDSNACDTDLCEGGKYLLLHMFSAKDLDSSG
ncbi:hypothetical protein STEG23_030714, partial [Scotinomys teguina]